MTLAQIAREARKKAGLTVPNAAGMIGISERQLLRYEHGQCLVPEDVAFRMSVVYDCQEIREAWRQQSVFEQEMGALRLDGANPDPVAALVKYAEELEEAGKATHGIIRLAINLRVSEQDREKAAEMIEQAIYDVKTALSHAEINLLSLLGIQVGLKARRSHKQKCLLRGYIGQAQKEIAATSAAR